MLVPREFTALSAAAAAELRRSATPKQQGGAMRQVLVISLLFFSLVGLVSGEENTKRVKVKIVGPLNTFR
jgi:hypothetical protein